jgi:hypothetical protein
MRSITHYFDTDQDPITDERFYGLEPVEWEEEHDHQLACEDRESEFHPIRVMRSPGLSAGAMTVPLHAPADNLPEAA